VIHGKLSKYVSFYSLSGALFGKHLEQEGLLSSGIVGSDGVICNSSSCEFMAVMEVLTMVVVMEVFVMMAVMEVFAMMVVMEVLMTAMTVLHIMVLATMVVMDVLAMIVAMRY